MRIQIVTLFPKMFEGPFSESIISRAKMNGILDLQIHDLRKWGIGERRTVDDRPYGGGVGMVLRVDVVAKAIEELKTKDSKVILMTPQGKKFNQKLATEMAAEKDLILICGHYEGFDERVRDLVDQELSIGDYVLTGGEIPAMVIIDSVVRLIPGVLPKEDATKFESFNDDLLEYPHYTQPRDFNGSKVPEVLLSGNHGEIEKWRTEMAIKKTSVRRPDLLHPKHK